MKQAVVPLKGEAGEPFSAHDVATDVVNLRYIFTQTMWRWSSLATGNEQGWLAILDSVPKLPQPVHVKALSKMMNKHWSVVEVPRIGIERFPIESCLYREEVQKRSFPGRETRLRPPRLQTQDPFKGWWPISDSHKAKLSLRPEWSTQRRDRCVPWLLEDLLSCQHTSEFADKERGGMLLLRDPHREK